MHGRLRRAAGRFALLTAAVAAIGFGVPSSALAAETATVRTAGEFETAVSSKASPITVAGNFQLDGEVTLPEGSDITLNGSGTITAGEAGGIKVSSGSKLTIDSEALIFDGGNTTEKTVAHTVPFIWSQGELTLKAGTIQNFTGGNPSVDDAYLSLTGVSVVYIDATANGSKSIFAMDGGTIRKNATTGMSYGGAGVKLLGKDASMTMNGGTITQNSAQRTDTSDGIFGGGILMFNGGMFTMNGGTISDNVAGSMDFQQDALGGGVAGVGMGYSANMVMNGGTITGNKALSSVGAGHGGGVFMHTSSSFVANGGTITNNETTGMGGGLYVDGVATDGVSANRFYNTIITGNTATNLGGGLWICPIGYGNVNVTKGAAIYNNTAPVNEDKASAGDDFVVHPRDTDKAYPVTLADRMLGGGKAIWYKDGGLLANLTHEDGSYWAPNRNADSTVARYNSADPGDPVILENDNEPRALKNVTTEGAQNLANKLGKVFISNNKAAVGGGVATNQMISFGGDDEGKDVDYSLTIGKQWDESVSEADRKEVTVDFKIGDEVVDTVKLNADNNWEATLGNLPKPDGYEEDGTPYILDKDGNHLKFEIVEQNSGYDVTYGKWDADDDQRKINISLTNSMPKTGDMSLTKKVKNAQTGRGFDFVISLTDAKGNPIEGKFTAEVKNAGGQKVGDINDLTFDEKGKAKVVLCDGWTLTLTGLPDGAEYRVKERPASGFKSSIKDNGDGKITAGETVANNHVIATNTYVPPVIPPVDNDGDLDIEKKVVGEGAPKDAEFTFTVTTDPAVKDGTYGDATFKDGVATIVLKAGQTAHIKDLPKGTKYTVTEAESKHFISSIKNGSGTITAGKVTVTATNTYEKPTGDLEIGKTVKGEGAPNASFTFDITLTDADGKPVSGTFSGITFEDGSATVTLKAGEKVLIEGLPAGTSYKVTERATDGFASSIDGAVGTIPEDGKAVVSAVNTYEPEEPEKPVDPDKPKPEEPKPNEPDKPSKPEKPDKDLPQTGDSGMSAVALTAVALSGAVLVAGGAALLKKRSSR